MRGAEIVDFLRGMYCNIWQTINYTEMKIKWTVLVPETEDSKDHTAGYHGVVFKP